MKYLFYLIFILEMGFASNIANIFAEKIKNIYEPKPLYNILGAIGFFIFFIISAVLSYDAWINVEIGSIILGLILLCIAFFSLSFVQ
ncbi:MAG: hypothetical protein GX190_02900, partial [Mollicutes bacterium]|nr:hypothetical protein [Mollicutes bacterium]